MNNKNKLILDQVSCRFAGADIDFFHALSLTIPQSLTFIMGKNGVGKSTFMKLCSGDCHSFAETHGTIIIDGLSYDLSDVTSCATLQSHSMTMSQNNEKMLAYGCTGEENLAGARMPYLPSLRSFRTQPIPTLAQQFDIPLHIPVSQLSGGQRQMLVLLMAVQKPVKLLLLDEPTAALDDSNAERIMIFLQQLIDTYSLAVLCITHDTSLMESYGGDSYIHLIERQGKRHVELCPVNKKLA